MNMHKREAGKEELLEHWNVCENIVTDVGYLRNENPLLDLE